MSEKELTRKDRVRIELAVRRVDYKLDGRVPWRRRRQIRAELRSNLIEAARDVGAEAAVQQLGDLNELATSYLELYRGRFDFRAGAYWGLAAYVLIQVIGIAVINRLSRGRCGDRQSHRDVLVSALERIRPVRGQRDWEFGIRDDDRLACSSCAGADRVCDRQQLPLDLQASARPPRRRELEAGVLRNYRVWNQRTLRSHRCCQGVSTARGWKFSRIQVTASLGERPSRMASAANAVPVRPMPPLQITSTRSPS